MSLRPLVGAPRAHFHRLHRTRTPWAKQRAPKLLKSAAAGAAATLEVAQGTAQAAPRSRGARASWSRGVNAALVTPVLHLGDGVLSLGLRQAGFRALDVTTPEGSVRLWDAPGRNPEGPVMVVLHGLAGSSTEMGSPLAAVQRFASRVISVDLPGHGGSFVLGTQSKDLPTGAPPHACIERMVRAVNSALDAVIDGPVVLCGHSLGGYLAARYRLEGSQGHLARLQLVEPDGAPWTEDEAAQGRAAMDVRTRRAASALAHDTFPTRPLRAAFYTPFVWARFAAPTIRYLVHSDAFQPVLAPEQLAALPADTLLVRGRHERFNAPHTLDYLQAHLPANHPMSHPETGHGDICCGDAAIMEALENHALGLVDA